MAEDTQNTPEGNISVSNEPQEEQFFDLELARYEAVLERSLEKF